MIKRTTALLAAAAAGVILSAVPASAHSHYLELPTGRQQYLAGGEAEAAELHPLHCNVHIGTPGTFAFDQAANPVDIQKHGSFSGTCPR